MNKWTYTILNVIFFVPVFISLFLVYRKIIIKRLRFILLSGLFGAIWFLFVDPLAIHWKAWQYDYTKTLGINFKGVVVEELIWVTLVWMVLAILIEVFFERTKQKITIIIGLPGSGKTIYIKNNIEKFKNTVICDDYDKSTDTHRHSHIFKDSIYYEDLKSALLNGKDVVLTDISWCRTEMREALKNNIENLLKELKINVQIDFVYFENNPDACKKNILKRNREDRTERELKLIDKLSNLYIIPDDSFVISVVS